jgi:hypothetical protein
LKKIIIKIETENPEGVESYLREVLNVLSKNNFFSIKKWELLKENI